MHVWQALLVAAAFLATFGSVVSVQPSKTYSLALQWTPSACDQQPWGNKCLTGIPERFTIHGLQTQRSNGEMLYPSDARCNNNHIPAEELHVLLEKESFYDDLKEFWPNPFESPIYSSFWSAQWDKHGICSDFENDPVGYFKTGLNLFTDRFRHLREDMGIEVGETYTLEQVHTNLKKTYGVHPQVSCNKRNQLWEIRFCYRKVSGDEQVDIVDCPELSDAEYLCDENEVYLPRAQLEPEDESKLESELSSLLPLSSRRPPPTPRRAPPPPSPRRPPTPPPCSITPPPSPRRPPRPPPCIFPPLRPPRELYKAYSKI